MNDHKEHISHYSAADIQRYVQGKLSAREMHAMEKAALDDPFLADAIEGMQQALTDHKESLVTGQLHQLQQQFKTRTATGAGKVMAFKPFRYWQAAAAVVAIVTGVWIYSLVNNDSEKSKDVIAKTEEKKTAEQQATTALSDSSEIAVSTDSTTAQGNATNATISRTDSYRNSLSVNSKNTQGDVVNEDADENYKSKTIMSPGVSRAEPDRPSPAANSVAILRQQTNAVKQDTNFRESSKPNAKDVAAEKKAAAPTPTAAVPETTMKARKAEDVKFQDRERETELITITKKEKYDKKSAGIKNNLSGVIKGQVTDLNNNPVANAYIQITKEHNNIITDKTGFFNIPVSDSVVDVTVNVTGYGSQNFRLQNNAAVNQLQLQPANAALDEVVVQQPVKGKKLSIAAGKLPNTIVHDAEPVIGWAAFDQYLEKNRSTMSGAISRGHVVISFQVNKKGTLSDFKIEQSLSKAYDNEAVRLITQGPAWKLLKGRKARITVMVRF